MDQNLAAMYEHFTSLWNAGKTAIVPDVELRYQGLVYPEPDRAKYWARISTMTSRTFQSTLSTNVGAPGRRRYTVEGYFIVQVFGPRNYPDAWDKVSSLANLAKTALRQPMHHDLGNVWFKDVSVENQDPEDNWVRFDTLARFTYDEFE